MAASLHVGLSRQGCLDAVRCGAECQARGYDVYAAGCSVLERNDESTVRLE